MNKSIQKLIDDNKWRDIHNSSENMPENLFFLIKTKEGNTLHSKKFAGKSLNESRELLNSTTHWRHLPDDRLANALQVAVEALVEVRNSDDAHEIWFQQIAHEALQKIQQIAEDE